ncbi:hypothetical protein F7725_001203, partial [Dissostichus mawsoni]
MSSSSSCCSASSRLETKHSFSAESTRSTTRSPQVCQSSDRPSRLAGVKGSGVREGKESAPDGQVSNSAQVTQQPPDSLLELREAGQRIRRLELTGVHPGADLMVQRLHVLQQVQLTLGLGRWTRLRSSFSSSTSHTHLTTSHSSVSIATGQEEVSSPLSAVSVDQSLPSSAEREEQTLQIQNTPAAHESFTAIRERSEFSSSLLPCPDEKKNNNKSSHQRI